MVKQMCQKGKKNKKQGIETATLGNCFHTHISLTLSSFFLTLKNQEVSRALSPEEKKIQLLSRFSTDRALLLWTKKYSHNLKVELFYLVGMFRTPSPGDRCQ